MNRVSDREARERERKTRRKVFQLTSLVLALTFGGLLVWKLGGLILPIVVGAILAFLFRPIKERFRIPWLPHELQVLCSFAAIGLLLFFVFDTVRQHIPDEKEKLEFKVRLKYRLNEKYKRDDGQFRRRKIERRHAIDRRRSGPGDGSNQFLA